MGECDESTCVGEGGRVTSLLGKPRPPAYINSPDQLNSRLKWHREKLPKRLGWGGVGGGRNIIQKGGTFVLSRACRLWRREGGGGVG